MIVKSAARMTGQIMKSFFCLTNWPFKMLYDGFVCGWRREKDYWWPVKWTRRDHIWTSRENPERSKNHTVITRFSLFFGIILATCGPSSMPKNCEPFFHCRHRFWLCFPHAHSATSSSNLSRNSFFSPVKISDRWEDIRKGLPSLTFFLRFMAKQEINETAPKHQVLITEACKSPVGAAIARNFQQQLIEWNV